MEDSTFKQMSDNAVQFLLGRLHLFCRERGFDCAVIRGNNIVGFCNESDDKEFEEQNEDLTDFFRYFNEDALLDKMWKKHVGWV